MKTSAIVKREPPRGARPPTPATEILDIELTVDLPASPQVTFPPGSFVVYGGVIVEQKVAPGRTKGVVLIRPSGTVAREGSMKAALGLVCPGATGTLNVDMKYALPIKAGDKVTITRADDS